MKNKITDFYKKNFIKAVISTNKKLFDYLHNHIKTKDIKYSNTIGYGGDNSLNIDLYAENLFIKNLSKFGNIYSEECGFKDFGKEFTIIIDPIDGSNNFFSNLEYYASSIALRYQDKIIAGFVCNLASGRLIYRAFDSEVIEVSLIKRNLLNIHQNKLAIFERAYEYPKICKNLSKQNIKFRTLGASALSLANARNYLFVLLKGKIREFDVSAALYICKDLYIYKNKNTIFISKSKKTIKHIKKKHLKSK